MCDLLGMCFNRPIRPTFSFDNFRFKDNRNPDGWGVAFYPISQNNRSDKSALVIKEARPATSSDLAQKLIGYDYLCSNIIISHVRASSGSDIAHRNTHPFYREFNGKEYIFAHNGTLNANALVEEFENAHHNPIGETDSEKAFCIILNGMNERGISRWSNEDFIWIGEVLREINTHGYLNCLLSDGESLFCYADKDKYNCLSYIERRHPFNEITLLDKNKKQPNTGFVNLSSIKDPSDHGFIIATTVRTGKPTNEHWIPFIGGELKIFRGGELIFSSLGTQQSILEDVQVLKYIKLAPHKVTIKEISECTQIDVEKVRSLVKDLYDRGYIRRTSHEKNPHLSDNASYYTVPSRRNEISRLCKLA